jgi:hypothetical protein
MSSNSDSEHSDQLFQSLKGSLGQLVLQNQAADLSDVSDHTSPSSDSQSNLILTSLKNSLARLAQDDEDETQSESDISLHHNPMVNIKRVIKRKHSEISDGGSNNTISSSSSWYWLKYFDKS